jgi:hypothetical protein
MIEGISSAIAVGVSMVIVVASYRTTKKREQDFRDRYGSFEGFRSQVDQERIQEVRGERGNVAAIKVVREEYPYVSLAMAKRYVYEMPDY